MRKKEAKEKGSEYDPLKDEDIFLQQRDFDMYYKDLAALSRIREKHDVVPKFPFYEEARQAIPDEREWEVVDCEKRVVMVRKGKSEGSLELRPKMLEEHRDGFFASKAIRDRVFDLKVQSEQARIVFHQKLNG